MKPQAVRLVDVFLIGPAMIYVTKFPGPPLPIRWFLGIAGVATIAYNLHHYLSLRTPKRLR